MGERRTLPPNNLLRQARLRLLSPSGSGRRMSRQELAEAVNIHLWRTYQIEERLDERDIGKLERGAHRWPRERRREAFRAVLGVSVDAELGFYVNRNVPTLVVDDTEQAPAPSRLGADVGTGTVPLSEPVTPGPLSAGVGDAPDSSDGAVRRRSLLGFGATTLFAAAGADGLSVASEKPDFVEALTRRDAPVQDVSVDLDVLARNVTAAKRGYQACRYGLLAEQLPPLLERLRRACLRLEGDDLRRVCRLAADAYQVAGSVLIKRGDLDLAVLAADRSMSAATRSGDPLAVGASTRIVTHTLINGGHLRFATSMAIDAVQRLGRDVPHGRTAFSVAGALLLRASLAAARQGDRDTTAQLLDEADAMANHLGQDANERWTAFGPSNVLLHRVSTAVSLGDAGHAVAYARRVPLDKVMLAERRACLLIDVARALAQWGKLERACQALLAAEHTAPEEVRTRPAVRSLVGDLVCRTPPGLNPELRDLAGRIGASR